MRQAFRICVFFIATAICAAPALSGNAPARSLRPADQTAMAPADSYFGPFGMSPLSIRSTIGLLGREYHYRTISDHDLLRKALITEDALRKWRARFPADPWLAPTFFHLEQLYQAVQTDEARKHASAILADVMRNYPTTKEGHQSRVRQAAGFPPLIPESALVLPTPAPSSPDAPTSTPSAGAPTAEPSGSAPASNAPTPATSANPKP